MSVSADRFRWTLERFQQAVASGVISPEERFELIEGDLIAVVPPRPSHSAIVKRLYRLLLSRLDPETYDVSSQQPLALGPESHPEPDIMIAVGPASRYDEAHPGAEDALLVIEVSDTSLAYDRGTKVPLYARYRIPEAWIVDVNARTVEVFRNAADGRYEAADHHAGGVIESANVSDLEVGCADIFGVREVESKSRMTHGL